MKYEKKTKCPTQEEKKNHIMQNKQFKAKKTKQGRFFNENETRTKKKNRKLNRM